MNGIGDSVGLHWFRKDLRLHDNRALLKAVETCSTLIPLYIIDTEFLSPEVRGVNHQSWVLDTLRCLNDELREKGSQLFVVIGRPINVLLSVIEKFNVKMVTWERDTEPYNKEIDDKLYEICRDDEIEAHRFWGHTLYDPDYLLQLNEGTAPLTMTGFLNLVALAGRPLKPMDAPSFVPSPPTDIYCGDIFETIPVLSDLKSYGYNPLDKTTKFVAGERAAFKRMERFLAQKKRLAMFDKPKTNPTSIEPDTTALSPYIARGSLSARLFHSRILEALEETNDNSRPTSTKPILKGSLEGQLYWREMAYLVAYSTPNFNQMVGNPVCKQIPWLEGEEAAALLYKWEMGKTGYPAVDATMNQLRIDGWMHHLGRHLVACFLTRGDLWVHWELGRDIFNRYLLDSDWSITNFSWHWLSCSAFFHQYFRCYGPATFFKRTDPTGAYVRKFVPVLKNYPDEYIYEPWKAPMDVQEAANCIIGRDYPMPIVDHEIESKRNMAKMRMAYMNAQLLNLNFMY